MIVPTFFFLSFRLSWVEKNKTKQNPKVKKRAKSDKHVMAYYERLERRVWFCVREETPLKTGGAQGPRRNHFRGHILPFESIICQPLEFITKYHNYIVAHYFVIWEGEVLGGLVEGGWEGGGGWLWVVGSFLLLFVEEMERFPFFFSPCPKKTLPKKMYEKTIQTKIKKMSFGEKCFRALNFPFQRKQSVCTTSSQPASKPKFLSFQPQQLFLFFKHSNNNNHANLCEDPHRQDYYPRGGVL